MSEKNLESLAQLKSFIKEYDLKNNQGHISFNARVKIKTSNNSDDFDCKVWVYFDDHRYMGTLQLSAEDLDPYTFPTQYIVDFNNFENKDSVYLLITGNHPIHGKFSVKITNPVIME